MPDIPQETPLVLPRLRRLLHDRTALIVLALLVAMAVQIVVSVHGESVTWDEGDHLFAGFMSLRTGDFGLNPEHPPMVKMVAALPLLRLHLRVPPLGHRYFKTEAYMDGRDLLFGQGSGAGAPSYTGQQLIFRARLPMLVFPLTCALLIFFTAREMFGRTAALIALTIAAFEPNLLAHGPIIATDSAACCGFLASIFCFYRLSKVTSYTPNARRQFWARLVLAGVAGGFALAAKHSTFFLLPMFVALIAFELVLHALARRRVRRAQRQAAEARARGNAQCSVGVRTGGPTDVEAFQMQAAIQSTGSRALQLFGALLTIILIACTILWSFYGFRYSARPAGLALSPSLAASCAKIRPAEAHILLGIAHAHLLPESYLYGLADIRNVGNEWPSYLFGHVYPHGIWPYFPASLLIKSTLPELLLLAATVFAIATGRLRRPRELAFLLIPIAVYLAAAMSSGLNIGMRHVLPLYPLAIVLVSGGAVALLRTVRKPVAWSAALAALLLYHAASSLHAFPTYIAYSNEAFGGPAKTYKYLTDSSVDWGQQLVAVKRYTDAHGIHDCWFAYFVDPFIRARDYGIPCGVLPTFDNSSIGATAPVPTTISGTVLISQGDLTGYEYRSNALNPLAQFQRVAPVALIQDGVFVYQGTFAIPEGSSMAPLTLSRQALEHHDLPTAIRQGEAAVAFWPTGIEQQEQLGDALAAAGRQPEANIHYTAALAQVQARMEPEAKAVWIPQLQNKLRAGQK